MVLNAILDPVFSPLLKFHPLLSIFLIALVLSFLMTLAYKKFTNQDLMKQLKDEIKEFQEEMKRLKDNPAKMMEIQKQAMETNMKYMMQSFKPTLITFIPLIIIFGWLHAHMGYYPLIEQQEFSALLEFEEPTLGNVTIVPPEGIETLSQKTQVILENKAVFFFKGNAGDYTLSYEFKGQQYNNTIVIVKDKSESSYKNPIIPIKDDSQLEKITISNKKIQPLQGIPVLESIPWIGGFGWLGTYILFSIAFSLGLRKIMKVY